MATESSSPQDDTAIFRELELYSWDKDAEFQGGLSAILGNTTSESQIQELTLRAQCFYFSRKKSIPIDFLAYKSYLSSNASSSTPQDSLPIPGLSISEGVVLSDETEMEVEANLPSQGQPPSPSDQPKAAPYPPTFAEIVALITAGKPIPGIKEIPPTVLADKASKPVAGKRRKPWEKEDVVLAEPGVVGVTFGSRMDRVVEQELPDD